MELMKYYNIDSILLENQDKIEVYGKTITNKHFYIEILKNQTNILGQKINISENPFITKSRINIRKKNLMNWINVGDDMNFYLNYKKYMQLDLFLIIHNLIIKNL